MRMGVQRERHLTSEQGDHAYSGYSTDDHPSGRACRPVTRHLALLFRDHPRTKPGERGEGEQRHSNGS